MAAGPMWVGTGAVLVAVAKANQTCWLGEAGRHHRKRKAEGIGLRSFDLFVKLVKLLCGNQSPIQYHKE